MYSDLSFDLIYNYRNLFGTPQTGYASNRPRSYSASQVWAGRLKQYVFECSLFSGTATRGDVEVNTGAITLDNSDGGLDSLLNVSFDDLALTRFSATDWMTETVVTNMMGVSGYGQYAPFFVDSGQVTEDAVTLNLRDSLYTLNKKPVLTQKYAGNNALPSGIEGTAADIGGQYKPRVYGSVLNIEPKFVNTSKLIYQLDYVGFTSGYTLKVYDQRVLLTNSGVAYTSQFDMESNAPVAGQYRVWPQGGCIRLGATPAGKVTCDLDNPVVVPGGVTGLELTALLTKIAYDVNGLASFTPSYSGGKSGIYVTEPVTALEVCNLIAKGGGYSFSAGPLSNNLNTVQANAPTPSAWTFTLTEPSIKSLRVLASGDDDSGYPTWRVTVRYAKNYTVMSDSDLAGAVSQADRAFVKQEYREVVVSDSSVKIQWPNAKELIVETLLSDSTAATNEANRLLTLYKTKRQFLQVEVPGNYAYDASLLVSNLGVTASYPVQPGYTVKVTHPRLGLSLGVVYTVIACRFDLQANLLTLTLWG